MANRANIVIAGAGAIGRTVAYVLARAGHAVTVVDPDPAGGNASRIAAGMLAPAFEALFDGGRFELLHEAQALWRPLAREIGLTISWDGAMAIGSKAEAEAWLTQLLDLGIDADMRDPAALRRLGGVLAGGLAARARGWRCGCCKASAERRGARFGDRSRDRLRRRRWRASRVASRSRWTS